MTNERIQRIMDDHGIAWKLTEDGHILCDMCDERFPGQFDDLTGWPSEKVFHWLGY